MLAGRFGELTDLEDIMAQRFLAINVLAHLNSGHCRDSVCIIRRRYSNRIDVLAFLIQHFAEITVLLHVRIPLECSGRMFPINITERNEVFRADLADITAPHAADADAGDIELFARRNPAGPAKYMTRNDGKRCRRRYAA